MGVDAPSAAERDRNTACLPAGRRPAVGQRRARAARDRSCYSSVGSRAHATGGGSAGRPAARRMRRASSGSVTTSRTRSRPWRRGQSRASTSRDRRNTARPSPAAGSGRAADRSRPVERAGSTAGVRRRATTCRRRARRGSRTSPGWISPTPSAAEVVRPAAERSDRIKALEAELADLKGGRASRRGGAVEKSAVKKKDLDTALRPS